MTDIGSDNLSFAARRREILEMVLKSSWRYLPDFLYLCISVSWTHVAASLIQRIILVMVSQHIQPLALLLKCERLSEVEQLLRAGGLRLSADDIQPLEAWLLHGRFFLSEQLQLIRLLMPICTSVQASATLRQWAKPIQAELEELCSFLSESQDTLADCQQLRETSPAAAGKKRSGDPSPGAISHFVLTPAGEAVADGMRDILRFLVEEKGVGNPAELSQWYSVFGLGDEPPVRGVVLCNRATSLVTFALRCFTGKLNYKLPKSCTLPCGLVLTAGQYDTHRLLTTSDATDAAGENDRKWKCLQRFIYRPDGTQYAKNYFMNARNKKEPDVNIVAQILDRICHMHALYYEGQPIAPPGSATFARERAKAITSC